MEYYFKNKKYTEGHGHGHDMCGCMPPCGGCGSCNYCKSFYQYDYEFDAEFNKYTEISKEKCEEATVISEEAKAIAIKAKAKEAEVWHYRQAASCAACEAISLWKEYNKLTNQSSSLLKEAQKALEEGSKTQKKYESISTQMQLSKICSCGHSCGSCSCNCCC